MEKKVSVTNFSEINSPQNLIAYLSDSANRLENTKNKTTQYVYHYTKLSNVVSIINGRFWWLNSPKSMNDGLEFQNISEFEQRNAVFLQVLCMIQVKVLLCGQCMLSHGKMVYLSAYLLRYSRNG